ncbi:MAG: YciI family protein [Peptococcaceae bacterium]|nr:YciI family protein [Peptococcaceae bacterium]
MFILNLTYQKPITEVEKFLPEHNDYLSQNYAAKNFICSGRKNPRTGGIILCNSSTKENVEQLIKADPFFKEQIAHYEIIEFVPSKYLNAFQTVIDETK